MEKIKKGFITLILITFICQNAGFCVFERDSALRPPMTSVTRDDSALEKITSSTLRKPKLVRRPSKQLAAALNFFAMDPVLSSLNPTITVFNRDEAGIVITNPLNPNEFESMRIAFEDPFYIYTNQEGKNGVFEQKKLTATLRDCYVPRLREDLKIRIWIKEIIAARQKVLRLISSNPNRFLNSDEIMTETSMKDGRFEVPNNVVDNIIGWLLKNEFIARDENRKLYTNRTCILACGNIVKFADKGFIIYSQEGYKIEEVALKEKYKGFDSDGNYILTWQGSIVTIWYGASGNKIVEINETNIAES